MTATGCAKVHDITLKWLWTGLGNFLRPFREVSKKYLLQSVAMFAWGYKFTRATPSFLRALLGATGNIDITAPTFRPS
jgi:hypothetical protein